MMKPIFLIFVIASAISIIHAKDYRIMVFGGGPAGLETARKFLTLRETNPEIEISKVTVIEKRKTPTRIQAIRLENRAGFNSMFRFPPDIRDQLFNSEDAPGCFNHVGKVNGDCVVAKVRGNDVIAKTEEGGEEKLDLRVYTGVVKISRLEEILREEVTRLNGEIIYTKESFVQEDGSIYVDGKVIKTEDFDLLVCADGSNSICR
ncbi:hypothetical protein BKA69DRAFT_308426 [Paraphysoderma sedebokerense]|nr:hypothetical protein BKA69DRAFT_308426 [Paraphysoderma sedebokerense]